MKIELTITAFGMTFHRVWGNGRIILIELAGIILTVGIEFKLSV